MKDEITKVTPTWSRFAVAVTAAILVVPAISAAQIAPGLVEHVQAGPDFELRYSATFSADDLTFGTLTGYDTVSLEGATCLNEPGMPAVPGLTVRIALPAGMAVTNVRLLGTESVELAGEYMLLPTQPPRPWSDPATEDDFVQPDPETYASAEAYPHQTAEFRQQTDLAGQGMALVRLYPLHYVPAEKKLTLCTSVDLVLEGVGGYECGDYLPERISAPGRQAYERMVADLVVNPGDVELSVSGSPVVKTRGVGPGDYDYVIITKSDWVDDFQPLADWKTQKGVPATIVTTTWIYSEYTGSNVAQIRAFVQDAHANWGTTYFLLGGDTDVVPYHSRLFPSIDPYESVPNDTYYADYDDDWTCEVHVGRASVTSTTAISTFNGKVFTYEKDPPLTSYAKTATFLGCDQSCGGGEGENCKMDIKDLYVPASWTYRREYDSEPGTHKADFTAYLNLGNNLVNHIDHCGSAVLGAGYACHGEYLSITNVNNLSNGDRQSIFYSIGCWPCDYPYPQCIAEAFVRNSGGGGVAFVGNSRYGLSAGGADDGESLRYDRYFYRSLFIQGHTTLGDCFSDHKNDGYQNNDAYRYCFTELTLLGDPELPIWTEDPLALTVSHDETLAVGEYTTFPVEVSSGGSPITGATVCLLKEGDVYEIEQTDPSGTATFGFIPGSTGTMRVTATEHNHLPYEGQAQVIEQHFADGDFDEDGDVDLVDFATFALCFTNGGTTPPPECGLENFKATDIDGDGDVDLTDFATFALNFTG